MNSSHDQKQFICDHCGQAIVPARQKYLLAWDEIHYTVFLGSRWLDLHSKCYRELKGKEEL